MIYDTDVAEDPSGMVNYLVNKFSNTHHAWLAWAIAQHYSGSEVQSPYLLGIHKRLAGTWSYLAGQYEYEELSSSYRLLSSGVNNVTLMDRKKVRQSY